MTVDLTPEALDALEKRLRDDGALPSIRQIRRRFIDAADTIAALRAHSAPAPQDNARCCMGLPPKECATVPGRHCDGMKPAPVDPTAEAASEWDFPDRLFILPQNCTTFGQSIEAPRMEYRRTDLPPTLAEAMTVPEVRALVVALETLHIAATLMADRCGLRNCDEALDESHDAPSRLKGETA